MSQPKIGDHVTVGPYSPQKVAWKVAAIHQADETHTYATIRSGNYGITKVVPIQRLFPWSPPIKEDK